MFKTSNLLMFFNDCFEYLKQRSMQIWSCFYVPISYKCHTCEVFSLTVSNTAVWEIKFPIFCSSSHLKYLSEGTLAILTTSYYPFESNKTDNMSKWKNNDYTVYQLTYNNVENLYYRHITIISKIYIWSKIMKLMS